MVHQEHMENLRDTLRDLLERQEVGDAVALLTHRHPADQADILERLDEDTQTDLVQALSRDQLAELLEYLDDEVRSRMLERLPAGLLAPILDRVDEDIAADIVQELPPEQQQEVVARLEDREYVEELLTYPPSSAGGRMSWDAVTLQSSWTVQESIDYLRRQQPDVEQPFYLYAIDEAERLQGVVGFRGLITAPPQTLVSEIMSPEPISVRATADQEEAAERMRHYNLLALPVVDEDDRLLGVITADNVLDVQVEEATEDMFRMAGVGVKEWAFSPVMESAGRRIPWLAFNMIWAFAGALIISMFEGTLDSVAALAIFMPMIAGQAGNSGIQTATIVVRSLALGEMEIKDGVRVLRKEWILGLLKGVLFGGVLAVVAWVWQDHAVFGLVAGAAMFLNMLVASTTGVLIPITLRRWGVDPAAIAGVFDTMITDLMGFLIYLGLASLLITQLT